MHAGTELLKEKATESHEAQSLCSELCLLHGPSLAASSWITSVNKHAAPTMSAAAVADDHLVSHPSLSCAPNFESLRSSFVCEGSLFEFWSKAIALAK